MKRILFIALSFVCIISCSEPPIPTLEIDFVGESIAFTPQALESENRTIEVTTNQESWDAVSNQDWCIVTNESNHFTISAKANNTSTQVPNATITVTAGSATPIKITVTQECVFLTCSPTDEWNFPEEGGTRTLTITCNSTWSIVAKHDWVTFSQSEGTGYADIEVNVSPSEEEVITNNEMTISCGDLQQKISISRDYKHKVYKIGDLYPDSTNPEGVVFRGGKSGRIVALTGSSRSYSYYDEFSDASDYSDGQKNMQAVKNNSSISAYPAFSYCSNMGEGWYFPAYLEVLEIFGSYDTINEAIESAGGTKIGSSLGSSTEKGYSQFYVVTYDGNTTNQKFLDKQTQVNVRAVKSY